MIGLWLGGALLGFGIVWPIAAGWWRKRKLDSLAELLSEARLYALLPLRLRALASNEIELAARFDAFALVTEELRETGLRVLGDLVEDIDAERMPQIARRIGTAHVQRIFASADGLVFGCCSRSGNAVKIELMSARDGELCMSYRSARPARAADPPFEHVRHFGLDTSLRALLEAHRAQVVDHSAPWTRVSSLELYVQEVERARQREIAWREAQDPDTLLDLDLRALFSERLYASLGSLLIARMAKRRDVAAARVVVQKPSPGARS